MSETTAPNPGAPAPQPGAPKGITLTPSAIEWVRRIRTKEGKDGEALRLGVKAGGCSGYSISWASRRRAAPTIS